MLRFEQHAKKQPESEHQRLYLSSGINMIIVTHAEHITMMLDGLERLLFENSYLQVRLGSSPCVGIQRLEHIYKRVRLDLNSRTHVIIAKAGFFILCLNCVIELSIVIYKIEHTL